MSLLANRIAVSLRSLPTLSRPRWYSVGPLQENLRYCTVNSIEKGDKLAETEKIQSSKVSLEMIQSLFCEKKPISMITAYDYPSAINASTAGVDVLLVGDSVGMVVYGEEGTAGVTVEDIIRHSKAVVRGAKKSPRRPFIVADLPFGSYLYPTMGVESAAKIMKEASVDAVKLEGGRRMVEVVEAIVKAGIPVMGHVGLTPQTPSATSGYKVQGKRAQDAVDIVKDVSSLEAAGVFSIVLEAIPRRVSEEIAGRVSIPTIGIGAGATTSGQVQVYHDVLGLISGARIPKFAHMFRSLAPLAIEGIKEYVSAVKEGSFPAAKHSFLMAKEEYSSFTAKLCDEDKYKELLQKPRDKLGPNDDMNHSGSRDSDAQEHKHAQVMSNKPFVVYCPMEEQHHFSPKFHKNSNATSTSDIFHRQALQSTASDTPIIPHRSMMSEIIGIPGSENVKKRRTVVIFGAGAMGCLFAYHLSQSGHHVTLVTSWEAQKTTLETQGLQLTSLQGIVTRITDIDVVSPTSVASIVDPFAIIVATKAQKTDAVGEGLLALSEAMAGQPPEDPIPVLTIQNGANNYEILSSKATGIQHSDKIQNEQPLSASGRTTPFAILQGSTTEAAILRDSPSSHVIHTGSGETRLAFLESVESERKAAERMTAILSSAGFNVIACPAKNAKDIQAISLRKLIINTCINPLAGVLSVTNGTLLLLHSLSNLRKKLLDECLHVAAAKQIPVALSLVEIDEVLERTAANRSSTVVDIDKGRQTEMKYIAKFIQDEARTFGLNTPHLDSVMALFEATEVMRTHSTAQDTSDVHRGRAVVVSSGTDGLSAERRPKVIRTIRDMRQYVREGTFEVGDKIGFVPTMGALHEGHMSLVEEARKKGCDTVIMSIFVNPKQFAAGEDLDTYPRTLDSDLALAHSYGVDAVFLPSAGELYPSNPPFDTKVSVGWANEREEGRERPHFFDGVATVVTKLLSIVTPTVAFFGAKDVQQCLVVSQFVRDLNLDVKIVTVETKRERDGLAMSSRNVYLTCEEREAATKVFAGLMKARAAWSEAQRHWDEQQNMSEEQKEIICSRMQRAFELTVSQSSLLSVSYAALCDSRTLLAWSQTVESEFYPTIFAVAVSTKMSGTKLLDNIALPSFFVS